MDNCARKFTSINLMSFLLFSHEKTCKKSRENIWDSHENLMKSLMRSSWNNQNLMRKRLKNHVKNKISWDSHEIWWKAHGNLMRIFAFFSLLMRISWDSHENLRNLTRIFVRVLVLPLIAAPTPLSAYPSSSTATVFSSSICRPSSATSAAFACSCCTSTSSTSSPLAHVVFNNLDSERRLLQRPAEDRHDQTSTHRLRSCHRRHSGSLHHHQRLHRHLRSSHPLPWAQTTAANPKSPNHRHPSRKKSNASSSFISGTVSY